MKVDLTGILVPCQANGKFVFLKSTDGPLLPIFSNSSLYLQTAKEADFEQAQCIRITDHEGFTNALLELKKQFSFKVALDVHFVEGNTRFKVIDIQE